MKETDVNQKITKKCTFCKKTATHTLKKWMNNRKWLWDNYYNVTACPNCSNKFMKCIEEKRRDKIEDLKDNDDFTISPNMPLEMQTSIQIAAYEKAREYDTNKNINPR